MMDARVGVSTYHNVALSAGSGLNTATDVGIPGANLDDLHERHDAHRISNGCSNPDRRLLAVAAVEPRRDDLRPRPSTMTKLWGNHTIKFGGDYRHNEDYLLQTQDQGGPRGVFHLQREPDRLAGQRRVAERTSPTRSRRSCSIGRAPPAATSRSSRSPARSTRRCSRFIHDKWQVSPKMTLDLGLRHEYYTPLVGIQAQGGLSNYDPVTNPLLVSGYGDIAENLGVKSNWRNFNPRTGRLLSRRRQAR